MMLAGDTKRIATQNTYAQFEAVKVKFASSLCGGGASTACGRYVPGPLSLQSFCKQLCIHVFIIRPLCLASGISITWQAVARCTQINL